MHKERYPMYVGRERINSIHDAIERTIKLYPDRIGCKYLVSGKVYTKTYREVVDDIKRIGKFIFDKCGYADKKVAFVSDTKYEWYVTYLSSLYYGCTAVPLDRQLNEDELTKQVEFADVSLIFFDRKNSQKISKVKENVNEKIEFVCLDQDTDESINFKKIIEENRECTDALVKPEGDALAEIVFTSGTTGVSKAVMISHHNIASVLEFCTNILDLKETDDVISFLPNNHLYFLSTGLIIPMYFGSAVCLNDSILKFKQNMMQYKPQVALMVPALLQLLKREIMSTIKKEGVTALKGGNENTKNYLKNQIKQSIGGNINTIICGGAFLDRETIDFYNLIGIELLQGYGISECSPLVSCFIQNRVDRRKLDSVGLIAPCCDVRIVEGEVCVRGDIVMLGYYKNRELTEEVMDEGWFKTGDLGYLDEDDYLYLTGRKKNLIILSNGENVCPEEIENLIYSEDTVENVLVYAENELIVAEIYPNKRILEERKIENYEDYIRKVILRMNKSMPIYKQVKKTKIRERPFDMTTTMKIKR